MPPGWYRARTGLSPAALADAAALDDPTPLDKEAVQSQATRHFVELVELVISNERVTAVAHAHHGSVPMAVVSGGPKAAVQAALEAAGILGLFDAVVTVEVIERGKPAPDLYLVALDRFQVAAPDCVPYEDTDEGLAAAKAAQRSAASTCASSWQPVSTRPTELDVARDEHPARRCRSHAHGCRPSACRLGAGGRVRPRRRPDRSGRSGADLTATGPGGCQCQNDYFTTDGRQRPRDRRSRRRPVRRCRQPRWPCRLQLAWRGPRPRGSGSGTGRWGRAPRQRTHASSLAQVVILTVIPPVLTGPNQTALTRIPAQPDLPRPDWTAENRRLAVIS
jgi:beta-phosphoglucomutase-like phosphatase (HAD superfamily)